MTALPTTTTAAVLVAQGAPLEIHELEIPPLKEGQVLVSIAHSGICHTQLGEVRGKRGPDPWLPHCLGHEGGGTVLAIGPGVTRVAAGDRVVVSWIRGPGMAAPGAIYQAAGLGKVNSGPANTFMTTSVVAENRLTALPPDFPLDVAALLGCAVPTGAGTVLKTAGAKAGESLAVFGLGGVGLSAMIAGVYAGCAPIIAVDVVAAKLDVARRLGATHVVDASRTDAAAAVREITGGKGVAVAIEAAGAPKAMESAYAATLVAGGRTVLAGNLPHQATITIDPFPLLLGRKLLGGGGDSAPAEDIPRYIEAHQVGRMPLEGLISHRFGLEDINRAMDMLERGEVTRAIVSMTGDR
ncbi:MAG: zinc-binding dehydrogenase [Alphaproteobacteria bacterium]|nr:zinc-binding dehydrogenase [Alphaproteobacteria bacterium]